MRAEEHVKRQTREILYGEQHVTGRQVLAGLPVPPGGGGNAKPVGGKGEVEVFLQPPILQAPAECDAGGVTMIVIFGVHRGLTKNRSRQVLQNAA